jgi:CheY-like chemotaxis protein
MMQSDGKNRTIEFVSAPDFYGDPNLIYQLFLNLVNNAIKFSSQSDAPVVSVKGQIVEKADPKSQTPVKFAQIDVIDNGIGFEAEKFDSIMKAFKRLVSKNDYDGSGIGLGTVSKIVKRHNGHIAATSKPGEGATFSVFIPINNPKGKKQSIPNSHKFKILILDDNPLTIQNFYNKLSDNFEVLTSDEIELTLSIITHEDLLAIVSDIDVFEQSGLDLLRQAAGYQPKSLLIAMSDSHYEDTASLERENILFKAKDELIPFLLKLRK